MEKWFNLFYQIRKEEIVLDDFILKEGPEDDLMAAISRAGWYQSIKRLKLHYPVIKVLMKYNMMA